MNKYKLLFDILKPKVGPDCARIIIYDIYCRDCHYLFSTNVIRNLFLKKFSSGDLFSDIINYRRMIKNMTAKAEKNLDIFCGIHKLSQIIERLKYKCLEYDHHRLNKINNSKRYKKNFGLYTAKYGDNLWRQHSDLRWNNKIDHRNMICSQK